METTRGQAIRGQSAPSTGVPTRSVGRQAESSEHRAPFVPPRLTRHEPLTRITLVSGNDFPGSGGAGGTFFGG